MWESYQPCGEQPLHPMKAVTVPQLSENGQEEERLLRSIGIALGGRSTVSDNVIDANLSHPGDSGYDHATGKLADGAFPTY